jgi:hypothetical protein
MTTICCLLLLCSTVLGSPIDLTIQNFANYPSIGGLIDYRNYVNGRLSKNPVIHHDAKLSHRAYLETWLWLHKDDPLKIRWLKWLMDNPTVDFNTPSPENVGRQRLSSLPTIAITEASHMGDVKLAMQLLKRVSLDEKMLFEVVRHGDFEFIKQLFELEEYKGKYGRHSFLPATFSTGNLELVKYFLGTSQEIGFTPKSSNIKEALLTEDELILAGEEGSPEIIGYLLNLLLQNEEIDIQSKAQKILIGATRKGKLEVIEHIFAAYPTILPDDANDLKKSLLVEASRSNDVFTVIYFCDRFKMEPNKACLYAAAESKSWNVMTYLARRLNLKLDRKRLLGANYPDDRFLSYDPLQYEKYLESLDGLESLE